MPMLMLRDGEEAVGSTHDLLAMAIAVQLQTPPVAHLDYMQDVRLEKMKILLELRLKVMDVYRRRGMNTNLAHSFYELYADSFRKYMQCYPGSRDLRILPLDRVDVRSSVSEQARKHLQATLTEAGDGNDIMSVEIDPDTAYPAMLLMYGTALATCT